MSHRLYPLLTIFVLTLISFVLKAKNFYLIEPLSQDQASYIYWLQSIINSQNFFFTKIEDLGFLSSLKIDGTSALHNFLSPIYTSPINLLTIVSLGWFALGSIILSASVTDQIILSILANSIVIFLVSSYLIIINNKDHNKTDVTILSILIFFLLSFSSFIYGFSTYGTHNVGVLFLIINLFFAHFYLQRLQNNNVNWKIRIIYISVQTLALYSMYTNVFLIPLSFLISLFFINLNLKKKISEILNYLSITTLTLLPVLILFIFSLENAENDQGFIYWGKWAFSFKEGQADMDILKYFISNVKSWYNYNSLAFGKISFILSFFGLYLISKKYKYHFIFSIPIAHFLISFLMAGFNYAQSRTSAYLLPFNSIGLGILIFYTIKFIFNNKDNKIKTAFTIFLLITGIAFVGKEIKINLDKISKPYLIKATWSSRYANNNKNVWKKAIFEINKTLPDNNVVFVSNNAEKILLSIMDFQTNKLNFFGALDSLDYEPSFIKKNIYLNRYNKIKKSNSKIFLINFKEIGDPKVYSNLTNFLCGLDVNYCNKNFKHYKNINIINDLWDSSSIFILE